MHWRWSANWLWKIRLKFLGIRTLWCYPWYLNCRKSYGKWVSSFCCHYDQINCWQLQGKRNLIFQYFWWKPFSCNSCKCSFRCYWSRTSPGECWNHRELFKEMPSFIIRFFLCGWYQRWRTIPRNWYCWE